MVDPYESEKEQIEALRRWWRENGRAILAGVVIGLGVLLGWRYWQQWEAERAAEASATYERLMERFEAGDADGVAVLVERLAREHGDTAYLPMARLALAALLAAEGRLGEAEGHLRKALEAAPDPALEALARIRLARVLAARGERAEARALLEREMPEAFEPLRAELQGDLAADEGDRAAAREAYGRALRVAGPGTAFGRLVELKRDAVGVLPEAAGSGAGGDMGAGAEAGREKAGAAR